MERTCVAILVACLSIFALAACSSGDGNDDSSTPTPAATAGDGTVFTGEYAEDFRAAYDSATSKEAREILKDGSLADLDATLTPLLQDCVVDEGGGYTYSSDDPATPGGRYAPLSFDVSKGGFVPEVGLKQNGSMTDPDYEATVKALDICEQRYDVKLLSDLGVKTHRSID